MQNFWVQDQENLPIKTRVTQFISHIKQKLHL